MIPYPMEVPPVHNQQSPDLSTFAQNRSASVLRFGPMGRTIAYRRTECYSPAFRSSLGHWRFSTLRAIRRIFFHDFPQHHQGHLELDSLRFGLGILSPPPRTG